MEGGEKSKGQRSTQCDTNRDEKEQTEEEVSSQEQSVQSISFLYL